MYTAMKRALAVGPGAAGKSRLRIYKAENGVERGERRGGDGEGGGKGGNRGCGQEEGKVRAMMGRWEAERGLGKGGGGG